MSLPEIEKPMRAFMLKVSASQDARNVAAAGATRNPGPLVVSQKGELPSAPMVAPSSKKGAPALPATVKFYCWKDGVYGSIMLAVGSGFTEIPP